MKLAHYLGLLFFALVVISVSLILAVTISRQTVQNLVASLDGQPAEAKVTITAPDEAVIEFPALVRGRRVKCTIYVNPKRKASSVSC